MRLFCKIISDFYYSREKSSVVCKYMRHFSTPWAWKFPSCISKFNISDQIEKERDKFLFPTIVYGQRTKGREVCYILIENNSIKQTRVVNLILSNLLLNKYHRKHAYLSVGIVTLSNLDSFLFPSCSNQFLRPSISLGISPIITILEEKQHSKYK